jgi:multidrug efflux pump subunit AcrA (membrane-fusion protein)
MNARVWELKDCSEAAEVLLSKPSRAPRWIALGLASLLAAMGGWAHWTEVDLVVRAPGRVRPIT